MNILLIIKFALLLLSAFTGYLLGYFLTETNYRLSKYRVFQFKAFECRPCLSFHLAWITSTFVALSFTDWMMLVIGVIFAFALFAGLKIDQNNRTINIEDYDNDKFGR